MSNITPPPPDPNSRTSSRRFPRSLKALVIVGGTLSVGIAAGAIAAQYFIYNRLTPIVENALGTLLDRPLELGEVQGFSLTGLTIDGAIIPPTDEDESYALADSVQVGFRPLHVLSSLIWDDRTLPITITLIDPEVYGYEDEDGQWLRLDIQQSEEEGPITIALERIQVKNATVALAPYPQALESPWENPEFYDALTELRSPTANLSEADALAASPESNAPTEPDPSPVLPIVLDNIDVDATLKEKNRFIDFEVSVRPDDNADIFIEGSADTEEQAVQVVLRTNNLQVSPFSSLLPIPGELTEGVIDANVKVAYHPDQPLNLEGMARARDIAAQLSFIPQPITGITSQLRLDGQNIFVEETSLNYSESSLVAEGTVNLDTGYDLTAQVLPITLDEVKETVNLDIPFTADGAFEVDVEVTGALANPVVDGVLYSIRPLQIDQIAFESLRAEFQFSPSVLDVQDIALVPAPGGLISGQGQVNLEADGGVVFDMQLSDIPGDAFVAAYDIALPNDYRIGLVNADVEVFGPYDDIQAVADWRLSDSSFPGGGTIRYTGSTLRVQDTQLAVEGGTVLADATVDLNQGQWRADVRTNQVNIGQFSPQVQGILTSNVALSGQLDNFSPAAIAISGEAQVANAEARLAPDSPSLVEPGTWNTAFRWIGNGLQVDEFTAPGIAANGFVAVSLDGAPAIGDLDFDVSVRQYDLSRVAFLLPSAVQQQAQIGGLVSFNGNLNGTLENPRVAGTAQLDNLAVNALAFESQLRGDVQFSLAEGGRVDLEGDGDRIFAQIDDRFLPTQFEIRNRREGIPDAETFTIGGRTQGDILTAEIRNFRLSTLQFDPLPDQNIGQVRGVVNANIQANLADFSNPSVRTSVAIAQPALGYIAANQFTGELRYQDGEASLLNGELLVGDSTYRLDAQADLLDDALPYQANLVIEEGHVQDILTALQIFSLEDLQRGLVAPQYEGSAALTTTAVGVSPDTSLLNRLAYISALVKQRQVAIAQAEDALIPPLDELDGNFEGVISASGSVKSGFLVDFDIQGQDWAWGRLNEPNTFIASGRLTPTTLDLQPFRFESRDSLVSFDGQVGFTQQSGTLQIANVPAELIQQFVALPFDLAGNIEATVDIGGRLDNPELDGTVTLADAELNDTSLEQVEVDFTYDEARLIADGGIFITGEEGMTIKGNIPYALPFMSVQPSSDKIAVDLDIRNEGLAFLAILSNGKVVWDGGTGNVDLQATGTLQQPLLQGSAEFEEGTISSPLLNSPISGITGIAEFNLDHIIVDQLNAQLDDGQVTLQGMLPIFNALAADSDNPLTLSFQKTPVRLEDFLSATLDGDVIITGAALAPVISGEISVANGRAFALNLARYTAASDPVIDAEAAVEPNPILDNVQIDELTIALSDSLTITGRPVFDLSAVGDLVINGTLADIQPEGTIQLTNGWVNVISTQFRLSQDSPNTATFSPENGLDPDVDLQLVARVRETNRVPVAPSSPFGGAEVADQTTIPTFGGLETVEIFATVDGPASQLSDNLTLSSDPTRSENQIIALLGGRTLDAIQSGDIAGGIAAFAGTGFLAGFGNDVADALGISEFRIFPTTGDVGGESRLPLTIGVEVGFDITRDFSVSVLEIVDGGSSPQFNFRYELTDEIRLRASTNLDNDSRAILEYRNSF
jgi:translocation and assembly module TamB